MPKQENNICKTCNGNHYVRVNNDETKFCTECNGRDEPAVKETVLSQAIDNFFHG